VDGYLALLGSLTTGEGHTVQAIVRIQRTTDLPEPPETFLQDFVARIELVGQNDIVRYFLSISVYSLSVSSIPGRKPGTMRIDNKTRT
jgi:hypothetical protein